MPRRGGTATYAIASAVHDWNIDDQAGHSPSAQPLLEQFYPAVFVPAANGQGVVLDTAVVAAVKLSTGPPAIEYTINPDATWSDGTPVTAADFQYVWLTSNGRSCRTCHPATTAGYADIRSITGSHHGRTVTVSLRKPLSDWQALFGDGDGLLPAHVARRHGDLPSSFLYFARHPASVSAGPFLLRRQNGSGDVTLVRNPRYAGSAPYLSRLRYVVIASPLSRLRALAAGRVSVLSIPGSGTSLPAVSAETGKVATYSHYPSLDVETLTFNLHRPAVADRALRLAVLTAVSSRRLIAAGAGGATPGLQPVANRFFVPQQPNYRDDVSPVGLGTGNLSRAEQILTDASYRGVGSSLYSPKGHRLTALTLSYPRSDPWGSAEAASVATACRALGIAVTTRSVSGVGQLSSADLWLGPQSGDLFPATMVAPRYVRGNSADITGYGNPQVAHYLNAAITATSTREAGRDDDIADLQISEDALSLPIYQIVDLLGVSNSLFNVHPGAAPSGPAAGAAQWGLRP